VAWIILIQAIFINQVSNQKNDLKMKCLGWLGLFFCFSKFYILYIFEISIFIETIEATSEN